MDITPYLRLLIEKQGSDLFFIPGAPVKMKVDGIAVNVGKALFTYEMTEAAAFGLMSEHQIKRFESTWEADFSVVLPDNSGRFRANIFRQRGKVAMVLRRIPNRIPTIQDLRLPSVLEQLVMAKRGLILVVGASGSGKSTTLASMIAHRNEKTSGHILTIEDPIEFLHSHSKSIVSQREVGVDTKSYRHALKAAMREAPDVILIGEIRDRESMEATLELCNTGHLCLSTLHANNASQALERVINLFPHDLHKQLYMDLSLNVRAVISQRLVAGNNGKRCAAVEVMINTPLIADLILKGEISQIKEAMESSSAAGMQTFDSTLERLYREGRIGLEEALNNSDSRTNLEAAINFS
jgi:twitching motility protein PilU